MTTRTIPLDQSKLIPRDAAPKCAKCGRLLWSLWDRSMGHAVTHRLRDGKPECWNTKACEKRRGK